MILSCTVGVATPLVIDNVSSVVDHGRCTYQFANWFAIATDLPMLQLGWNRVNKLDERYVNQHYPPGLDRDDVVMSIDKNDAGMTVWERNGEKKTASEINVGFKSDARGYLLEAVIAGERHAVFVYSLVSPPSLLTDAGQPIG